jgi:hypothetical protein
VANVGHRAGQGARAPVAGRVLREPLVHFLGIAAVIFAAHALIDDAVPAPADDVITVAESDIDRLTEQFAAVWSRPPTSDEMAGLIDEHVREEIYYREALALGLDRNDAVIRRRLRQKMEFLGDTGAAAMAPDAATLRAHFEENLARFTPPARLSFGQIFVGEGDARAALAALRDGADPSSAGQPTLLPAGLDEVPRPVVDGTFGEGFFEQVAALPMGVWAGPVRSSYGEHLVRVETAGPAAPPAFEDVRARVEDDWRREAAAALQSAQYEALRARYRVVLPGGPEAGGAP